MTYVVELPSEPKVDIMRDPGQLTLMIRLPWCKRLHACRPGNGPPVLSPLSACLCFRVVLCACAFCVCPCICLFICTFVCFSVSFSVIYGSVFCAFFLFACERRCLEIRAFYCCQYFVCCWGSAGRFAVFLSVYLCSALINYHSYFSIFV